MQNRLEIAGDGEDDCDAEDCVDGDAGWLGPVDGFAV